MVVKQESFETYAYICLARAQIQTLKSSILHHKNVLYIPNESLKFFHKTAFSVHHHTMPVTPFKGSVVIRALSSLHDSNVWEGELFPFGVFLRSYFLYKLVMKNFRSDHAMHLFSFLGG